MLKKILQELVLIRKELQAIKRKNNYLELLIDQKSITQEVRRRMKK